MVGVWARVSGAKRKSAAVRRSFCMGPPVMVEVRCGGWGCSVCGCGGFWIGHPACHISGARCGVPVWWRVRVGHPPETGHLKEMY